jgi:hypothetical protein
MTPLIDITVAGHVHTRLCNHAVGEMGEYVGMDIQHGLHNLDDKECKGLQAMSAGKKELLLGWVSESLK